MRIAHLPFDFSTGNKGGDGVDHDDIDGAAADQRLGNFQRLLTGIRLRHEQIVCLDAQFARITKVQRMFGIDECRYPSGFLSLGNGMERQGCLSR